MIWRYLADTSAWNRSKLVFDRWIELIGGNALAICTPVRLELLVSARGRADYERFASDLELLPQLPLSSRAERAAERTQWALADRGLHRGAKPVDLLVAAIAEVHGVTLLHYDHHFDAIARVSGQPTEWLARPGSLD